MPPIRCPSCRRALSLPAHLRAREVRCPAGWAVFEAGDVAEPPPRAGSATGASQTPAGVTPSLPAPGDDRLARRAGDGAGRTRLGTQGSPASHRLDWVRAYLALLAVTVVG